jgi:hypothetical protein
MLAKVSTLSVAEGQAQKRALFVVKQLVSLAVDTELMHNRVGLKAGT